MMRASLAMAALAALLYYWATREPFPIKVPAELNPQYDYIVVGAGSSGSALAARLAERHSVLVIEAGGTGARPFYSHWPAFAPLMQQNADGVDYAYETEPMVELHGRRLKYPRGRGLGGTALLYYMIANAGKPSDYASNLDGWKFADLKPYLRDVLGKYARPVVDSPLFRRIVTRGDYNDFDDGGMAPFSMHPVQYFVDAAGRRVTTATSHLLQAARSHADRLHVLTEATVLRVNIDGASMRAVGVTYSHGGKQHRVLVNYDVIACAGAIDTPKLLMLSGIGPADELAKHKIPVVLRNELVGRRLKDHSMALFNYAHNDSASVLHADQMYRSPLRAVYELAKYAMFGTGIVSTSGVGVVGFATTDKARAEGAARNIQFYGFFADPLVDGHFKYLVDIDDEVHESSRSPPVPASSMLAMAVGVNRPKSTGSVHLRSADAADAPSIRPSYVAHADDMDALLDGIALLTEKMRSTYGDRLALCEKALAACAHETFLSRAYWRCAVPYRLLTIYHPVGTCAMGDDPADSVVDGALRVHGVSGLRVADVSVLRDIPGANTHLPAVALALRAADVILQQQQRDGAPA